MTAGPRASASGERLMIARGIEAGWPRRLCGSVHESPVRRLPHAPQRKARRPSSETGCLRVKDSNQTLSPAAANPSHVLSAGTNDGQNDSPFRSHFHADDK